MGYEARFDGKAENYSAGRPAYSEALVDFLYSEMGFSAGTVIADIGCGTGKLSAQLLKKGSTVYGVEPNEGMRMKAEKALRGYGKFFLIEGNDASTGLGDRSVDHIVAAQAFHWFDPALFRQECERILRPGGKVFLIWNMRNLKYEVNQEWMKIFREFGKNFIGFNNGLVPDDPRIRAFFQKTYNYREFDNTLHFTKEILRRRLLSSSYAPMEGAEGYMEFLERVDLLFERYQEDGMIRVPHDSVVYYADYSPSFNPASSSARKMDSI